MVGEDELAIGWMCKEESSYDYHVKARNT
jgi:hypothetical protein